MLQVQWQAPGQPLDQIAVVVVDMGEPASLERTEGIRTRAQQGRDVHRFGSRGIGDDDGFHGQTQQYRARLRA
ncbi:Uncharacterised protein [Mycobacteroides abscessus subsp. abscessus]|nr:Uncharacterised protein [Mycobacteroides abscessus subsp. abscessus]